MTGQPPPPPPSVPPPPSMPPPPPGGFVPPPPAPGGSVGGGVSALNYAGWWQRAGALILDGLIAVVFFVPAIVTLVAGPTEIVFDDNGFDGPGLYEQPTGGTVALAVVLYIVGFIAYLVFYCRMVSRSGSSVGMKATGYRIIDAKTGENISMGKSIGRFFARILSQIPCYLGYLWPLWDAEKRTFHDMVAGTRAVRR